MVDGAEQMLGLAVAGVLRTGMLIQNGIQTEDISIVICCYLQDGGNIWEIFCGHTLGGTRPEKWPFFVAKINVLERLFWTFSNGKKFQKSA